MRELYGSKQNNKLKEIVLKVLGRLLKVVLTTSPWMLIVSVITIILAAGSAVIGSLFIERLIDTYVTPYCMKRLFLTMVHY